MGDTATESIIAALAANGITGLVVTILFQCWRNKNFEVYAPRLRSTKSRMSDDQLEAAGLRGKKAYPRPAEVNLEDSASEISSQVDTSVPPAANFFSLMHQLAWTDDAGLLDSIGMDAYVLLRFLKMCFKIGCTCSLSLVLLIPIYGTGEGNEDVAGINLYSMANLAASSNRLWASMIALYYFTFCFLYFIYKEYEHFAACRKRFFEVGDSDIHPQTKYSVIVENIPKDFQSADKLKGLVSSFVAEEEILLSSVSVNMAPLVKTVATRTKALGALEAKIAAYEGDAESKRPIIKVEKNSPVMCCGGKETDAINWWSSHVAALSSRVDLYQRYAESVETASEYNGDAAIGDLKTKTDSENPSNVVESVLPEEEKAIKESLKTVTLSGTGFLTLSSRKLQTSITSVPLISDQYPTLKMFPAPQPADIIWSNATTSLFRIAIGVFIVSCILYAGLAFWGIILAGIAAISTLGNLTTLLPFLAELDPASKALLAGLLPVVILNIFISLIPVIIGALSQYVEKRKTNSAVEHVVYGWFFLYQLANVFLIVLGGSIFNSLSEFIDNPMSVVALLGKAIPSVSVFFINFTICSVLAGVPMMFFRVVPVIIFAIYRGCFNPKKLTRRTIAGILDGGSINYGVVLPSIQYILAILLVYWAVAPILLGVATCYFGYAYLGFKYQYMFVVTKRFETGGQFWYGLYNSTHRLLMASTILSIVFMGIKQGIAQTILLAFLVPIIMISRRYTEGKFRDVSLNDPYAHAFQIDESSSAESSDSLIKSFKSGFYKPLEFSAAKAVYPYPYRIDDEPLVSDERQFNAVYVENWPEGEKHRCYKNYAVGGLQ